MLSRIRSGEVEVPPLEIRWTEGSRLDGPDALVRVSWADKTFRFAAELKARSTPKAFAAALAQAKAFGKSTSDNPMIVVPYLAPERLKDLEREQVSGIDLCGNALVLVPGKLLVLRAGAPNTFKESFPIRNVYRGTSSLVARALLLRGSAESLSDLDLFIRSRGGEITLTTISKVLRRMEEDVLIERRGGRARLLQPEALLQRLSREYRPAKITRSIVGSTRLARDVVRRRLAESTVSAVLSGQSSTDRYAVMGREERIRIYCASAPSIERLLGADFLPGDRFANIELLETEDPTVFFDARRDGGAVFSSPIQTFLELSAGDKREQETAEQVRGLILSELQANEAGG